jgi:beta-glucosidase/6-phospho-beta-glucosidase/beta-galactosidase
VLGWQSIASEYYRRYRKPMMLTETNLQDADQAPDWLWKTWHNAARLRADGVPLVGYTWYSLQDQVDWDIQLREIKGNVNPNGLYTLEREPKPAAHAFRDLAARYGDLPLLQDFSMGSMQGPPAGHSG